MVVKQSHRLLWKSGEEMCEYFACISLYKHILVFFRVWHLRTQLIHVLICLCRNQRMICFRGFLELRSHIPRILQLDFEMLFASHIC